MEITGNIVLIEEKEIKPGKVFVENGRISNIVFDNNHYDNYILPGLIDSHVHIESSMMTPENFGEIALKKGSVAVVSDPHEIANVLGTEGIDYMMENAKKTPLKIFFGIPSCVPATEFETSGATLSSKEIKTLLQRKTVVVLSEMMNFPGVVSEDPEIMRKIEAAKDLKKPIDGHAPGLTGSNLKKYIAAGIKTDHECATIDEALEKIALGMKILIREGSAARNFEALYKLIDSHTDNVMLCTDDSHPDELLEKGHIDKIVKLGIKKNINIYNLLKVACINPVKFYNLSVGLLKIGDAADFIVVDNLNDFNVLETYINGNPVNNKKNISQSNTIVNYFNAEKINEQAIRIVYHKKEIVINAIKAFDGDLFTKKIKAVIPVKDGNVVSDETQDLLKIVVLNRYEKNITPAVGFINGFGLKQGAIASTIAHDSHNIIAVGTSDSLLCNVINMLIDSKGGIAAVNNDGRKLLLPLPIAGLLSNKPVETIAEKYKELNHLVLKMGSKMQAPFMTLSFMALPVIPEIKITDKGLFDTEIFNFVQLIR